MHEQLGCAHRSFCCIDIVALCTHTHIYIYTYTYIVHDLALRCNIPILASGWLHQHFLSNDSHGIAKSFLTT